MQSFTHAVIDLPVPTSFFLLVFFFSRWIATCLCRVAFDCRFTSSRTSFLKCQLFSSAFFSTMRRSFFLAVGLLSPVLVAAQRPYGIYNQGKYWRTDLCPGPYISKDHAPHLSLIHI